MKKDEYDVIIIGAGIGGLVCGCYLAKAGMKVLIVEKNDKAGGYCTSFERDGFKFDACVHSLGSCRQGGILSEVLNELRVWHKVKIIKHNPSDTILSVDHTVNLGQNLDETIQNFVNNFPKELKAINAFFRNIYNSNSAFLLARLCKHTFKSLLDEYFTDERLKSILSIPLLGNVGLPPSLLSAGTAAMVYKEFILDGGYYPRGGMEIIPNVLSKQFLSFGGVILLSSLVTEIKIEHNKTHGVVICKEKFFISNKIISNCDMNFTLKKLVKNYGKPNFIKYNRKMKHSLSAFSIYLSLNTNLKRKNKLGTNIWILPDYNIENMYKMITRGDIDNKDMYTLCSFPSVHDRRMAPKGKESVCLFINAPFESESFWNNNRQKAEKIINRTEDYLPFLKETDIKEISDPIALHHYTFNYKGAAYGWASYPSQVSLYNNLVDNNGIHGLYFVGHWNGQGHGVPTMAYLGKRLSSLIIREKGIY